MSDYGIPVSIYCIAGNFRTVQTFAFFADRSAAAKIRTMKVLMEWTVRARTEIVSAKIKTTKISSKGLTSYSARFCTSKKFPAIRYYIVPA